MVETAFSTLTALTYFNVELNGNIPSKLLTSLKNLRHITLPDIRRPGQLPEILSKLTKLTSLVIESYDLTGTLPSSYSTLKKLKVGGLVVGWCG